MTAIKPDAYASLLALAESINDDKKYIEAVRL